MLDGVHQQFIDDEGKLDCFVIIDVCIDRPFANESDFNTFFRRCLRHLHNCLDQVEDGDAFDGSAAQTVNDRQCAHLRDRGCHGLLEVGSLANHVMQQPGHALLMVLDPVVHVADQRTAQLHFTVEARLFGFLAFGDVDPDPATVDALALGIVGEFALAFVNVRGAVSPDDPIFSLESFAPAHCVLE